jgi:hypothetical protein
MATEKSNWPLILGITLGVIGSVALGAFMYSSQPREESAVRLRDAEELIAECRAKIKEIEGGLQSESAK